MDSRQVALVERLQAFEFDGPDTNLKFAARLARENGWSVDYAERVLKEYKRYCFLALEAGHPATPSEDVDQAWHLHLVYTRSYWNEFCPKVLGTPLHHGPTKGGGEEAVKHDDWYRKTIASYERLFGEKPPADIWPDSETRFSRDLEWKRVNWRENWIVPKPRLGRIGAALGLTFVLTCAVGCVKGTPLDWQGEDFLLLYGWLLAVMLVFNLLVRYVMTRGETPSDHKLSTFDLAYLQGGKNRLFLTVVTELARRGHLNVTANSIRTGTPLPNDAPPLEREVVDQIARHGLSQAAASAAMNYEPMHEMLAERGLLVSEGRVSMLRGLAFISIGALLVFGLVKIYHGISIQKPIEFLAVLSGGAFLILLFLLTKPFLTGSGKRLMKERRARHINLKGGAADFDHNNPTVPLAVALYGVAALELGAFGALRDQMKPLPGSGNTASTSSGGCTGCSSGGDGGGGGCGGCGGGGD